MSIFARFGKSMELPTPAEALAGRPDPIPTAERHAVNGEPLKGPWPGLETAVFAMGCFWGAERLFWKTPGVKVTAVGYVGGVTPNPTYREVCSGKTGHTEGVLVVYDPKVVSFEALTKIFFEGHDPTQGMRQGNDVGTQYRSAIFVASPEHRATAETIRAAYAKTLEQARYGPITTTIEDEKPFYYAEPEHQQYLHKVPNGYCGLGGTGMSCPIGLGAAA
ncbi:peptide-methionine (S)-S-oxide reductase MsrA [Acuticoccus sp. M5D2P5]|uniref:peptide-methionine (S)-S-oxide reductase MsrA n=1 Tax=Acuticoccus kalidii TaxID=2910977 RepID=UPI001F3BE9C0|nr:peptide-methionine (S)-S-oxide reductase MsrA [Acuticoccus kalidii]MCF3935338.1 peptide-methionine (S)-S-oxide reductase MsrA [Acuticoccus kalidii]